MRLRTTAPEVRRAFPADGMLRRYFTLVAAGPSIHSTLEVRAMAAACQGDVPSWLLRQCQVGLAIHDLPPQWRDAVAARWAAWVEQEDARRVWQVAESRARTLEKAQQELRMRDGARVYRREAGEISRQLGDARRIAGEARLQSQDARTRRRRLEVLRAYQLGMGMLSEQLLHADTLDRLVAILRETPGPT